MAQISYCMAARASWQIYWHCMTSKHLGLWPSCFDVTQCQYLPCGNRNHTITNTCCHSLAPPHSPLPYYAYSIVLTHTQTAWLECCYFHDTYGPWNCAGNMVGSRTIHLLFASFLFNHWSINCRGSAKTCISCISAVHKAASVSLQRELLAVK